VTALLIGLILGFIAAFWASKKGYGWIVCIVLALCGIIGIIIAACLPNQNKKEYINEGDPWNHY
jgi:F0F1-type ATP synthase assembly protein I